MQELAKATNTGISVYSEQSLVPNITNKEKAILLALNEPKIKDSDIQQVELMVVEALTNAVIVLGHKKTFEDANELVLTARIITNELYQNYPNLTLGDIKIAIHRGAMGDFTMDGQITSVSTASVNAWIKGHIQLKQSAWRKQKDYEHHKAMEQFKKLTTDEMEERNKRYAIEAFAEYKKQQRYHDIGNTVYDYLDVKGLIQFSKERKIQIAQQAKQDYLKANSIAQATSKEDRTEKQKNIYEVTSQTKKGKDVLRMESKRLALKEYFDFLITTDQELKDLI